MAQSESPTLRHFVAYVEDQPGVLNRVTSLFRRRCYNIVSLNVGRTHEVGVSRMTFAVEADEDTARRIEANLYKLVNVLSVEDITDKPSLTRGLALIKVTVGQEKRSESSIGPPQPSYPDTVFVSRGESPVRFGKPASSFGANRVRSARDEMVRSARCPG